MGRSGSASGTGSASVTTCVISASTLANRGDNEGRMNVAALAIPLTGLFTCANLCAAATACRPCFVPPYEHERAALVRGRFWPVPHCVYAWLWLPTRSHGPPSAQGSRLLPHNCLPQTGKARPRRRVGTRRLAVFLL